MQNRKQLDSYSLLIVAQYLRQEEDFLNVMCVCKKFEETTDKFFWNPTESLRLFHNLQTQHIYKKKQPIDHDIENHLILYPVTVKEALKLLHNKTTKCKTVIYTKEEQKKWKNKIPECTTVIGEDCFLNTKHTSIEIPSGLTSIEKNGFCGCSLRSFTFPKHFKTMKEGSFSQCIYLKQIELPITITEIPVLCFNGCTSLSSITLPETLTKIEDKSFCGCSSLKNITIPQSVEYIGNAVFSNCVNLQTMKLPSKLTYLGNNCFDDCTSLKNIELPSTLQTLGKGCFFDCSSLDNIIIPSTITSLGYKCFCNCIHIYHITIYSTLKTFGKASFSGCYQLRDIVDLPEQCYYY